ncbi:beta-galactosidase [Rhodopirellula sallentina SM41]|uniref:Beta-galactosidase n=1 Tax=Rhodopirellula sallentina SM41 TaxID=1263870 RepID=M5UGU8_9BACT|nr:beta-galactosidase [Rhodopirellula sallentina SM41]
MRRWLGRLVAIVFVALLYFPCSADTPSGDAATAGAIFKHHRRLQDTENIVHWAEDLLPNHIVSAASGWDDVDDLGEIRDLHDYERFPSVTYPDRETERAIVLGETGGFGVPINGNNWLSMPKPRDPGTPDGRVPERARQGAMAPRNARADEDFFSDIKRPVYSTSALAQHYEHYIDTMWLGQSYGLSGGVYTQFTDMRHEQNGWLTFDRKVSKIPVDKLRQIHERLFQPVPKRVPLIDRRSHWNAANGRPQSAPFDFSDSQPATFTTQFVVASKVRAATLNIEITTSQANVQAFGYLLVYLDGKLIFDDKTRHRKPEHRISCIPLTANQLELLKPGTHELKLEVKPKFPITALDVHLDAVE